jgi:hypothetical protein
MGYKSKRTNKQRVSMRPSIIAFLQRRPYSCPSSSNWLISINKNSFISLLFQLKHFFSLRYNSPSLRCTSSYLRRNFSRSCSCTSSKSFIFFFLSSFMSFSIAITPVFVFSLLFSFLLFGFPAYWSLHVFKSFVRCLLVP